MPAKIDTTLLPPVIRDSVDPDILDRAQSIEWSINRDTGENERGFVDGSHEDYLSSQNLMYKSHGGKQIDWLDNQSHRGRDSGFEPGLSPGTPSLHGGSNLQGSRNNMLEDASATGYTLSQAGSGKRHPTGQYPFPIYKVNQEQLQGDVFFEKAPRARPGERTVHYEKSSRVFNEQELNALGLDPNTFGPNTNTMVDEQEEETIETSILKANAQELEQLYQSMRNQEAGNYFDRQRARSLSPSGRQLPGGELNDHQKRTVIFGSVEELNTDDRYEQEFYPYRDAHQGKPLPGDNEYGTWGSRRDEQRQWKLCNGQWVRIADPKPKPRPAPKEEPEPPKYEQYLAEQVKCKPPKRIQVARAEPVRRAAPETGNSTDSDLEPDDDNSLEPVHDDNSSIASLDLDQPKEPVDLDLLPDFVDDMPDLAANLEPSPSPPALDRSPPGERNFSPQPVDLDRSKSRTPSRRRQPADVAVEPDIEALKDKYRPKMAAAPKQPAAKTNASPDTTPLDSPKPKTGTILLKPPEAPVQIICEPIQPTYVEMKKPLKHEGEEEKMMEDPNLMWMGMGPAQYGPPFGTLKKRKAREEEWIGPPCELCHKQIEERRCMLAENRKFHCWHFACSFCLKTLKPADFLIAEADKKCYCLNCHKREFPEISLVGLNLEE